jgi:hypothetical protein
VGATKLHHLDDAVAALDMKLDEAELKALAEPCPPHPVPGHCEKELSAISRQLFNRRPDWAW